MTDFLHLGPQDGPLLILAHGAGAGMSSPFMELIAALLAERGVADAKAALDDAARAGRFQDRRMLDRGEQHR